MSTKYPTKEVIHSIFSHLSSADFDSFIAHARPETKWTLQSTTSLGTSFTDSDAFIQNTFKRFRKLIDPAHPISLIIDNIVGGADEEWTAVEMHNIAVAKDGQSYNQKYAWLVRWSAEGNQSKIVEGRVYLDSALVERVINSCES